MVVSAPSDAAVAARASVQSDAVDTAADVAVPAPDRHDAAWTDEYLYLQYLSPPQVYVYCYLASSCSLHEPTLVARLIMCLALRAVPYSEISEHYRPA